MRHRETSSKNTIQWRQNMFGINVSDPFQGHIYKDSGALKVGGVIQILSHFGHQILDSSDTCSLWFCPSHVDIQGIWEGRHFPMEWYKGMQIKSLKRKIDILGKREFRLLQNFKGQEGDFARKSEERSDGLRYMSKVWSLNALDKSNQHWYIVLSHCESK